MPAHAFVTSVRPRLGWGVLVFVLGAVSSGLTFAASPKPQAASQPTKPQAVSQPATAVRAAASMPVSAPQAEPEVGRRVALVIGNANYRNVPALENPVNDARAICSALKSLRFDATCLHDLPDRRAMRDAVTDFVQKLKPEDSALFYFAGHGIEVDGENYLIPTEANLRSKAYVEDEALRVSFIFDELREAKVRLSIILLDACRNNPFARVRAVAGTGLAIPSSVPAGSILIFPTSPGKTALDGIGGNGLFTTHLLTHINTPGITIEEMFKRVISGVREEAKKHGVEQIPWMNLSFTGEFCFVGCGTRVNTEQYLALLKQKEEVENATLKLQAELATRQADVDKFKQRMLVLEKMLEEQNRDKTLSKSELERLAKEREELAAQAIRVKEQEAELMRARTELARLEAQQAEFAKREKEIALANERIQLLERQIKAQEERRIVLASNEIDAIRRERDELLKKNEEMQKLQAALFNAEQDLLRMQVKLSDFDKQKKELDEYKVRMARLETEVKQKDEALHQMRGELESRQEELVAVRERLALLQGQLDAQRGNQKISASELAKVTQARDELLQKSQQLAERERELKEAREKLARLEEARAAVARREQDIAAHAERIAQLESELARRQNDRGDERALAELRRERDELARRNAELQRQGGAADGARAQELAELRQRLQAYDQQKAELDSYKRQLAEAEARLKDAITSAVKGASFVAPAL